MHVSVVVPAYNAEQFLRDTAASVLSQTWRDLCLVLVDNGSIDGTNELARALATEDDRVRVVELANNAGPAGARNAGLNVCSDAEAIMFLDADDLLLPQALSRLVSGLADFPDSLACQGRLLLIDADGNSVPDQSLLPRTGRWTARGRLSLPVRLSPSAPSSTRSIATWCIATLGAVLVRRAGVDVVGRFESTLLFGSDWDYWIRLASAGEIAYLDVPVALYRQHANAMSHSARDARREYREWVKQLACGSDAEVLAGIKAHEFLLATSKLEYGFQALQRRDWRQSAQQLRHALGHMAFRISLGP